MHGLQNRSTFPWRRYGSLHRMPSDGLLESFRAVLGRRNRKIIVLWTQCNKSDIISFQDMHGKHVPFTSPRDVTSWIDFCVRNLCRWPPKRGKLRCCCLIVRRVRHTVQGCSLRNEHISTKTWRLWTSNPGQLSFFHGNLNLCNPEGAVPLPKENLLRRRFRTSYSILVFLPALA